MGIIKYLIGDSVIFIALQIGLIVLFLYAIWGDQKRKKRNIKIKRGEKSWDHFYMAYGFLSVVVTQIISISEFGKGYKIIFTVVDLLVLLYLSFFNSWFRNKIMGFIVASNEKEG